MAKIKITTETGFNCEVDENALDNVRVLKLLVKMDSADATDFKKLEATFEVLEKLIGADGEEALYQFIEKRDGHAGIQSVSDELGEIFKALGESKKKS